MAPALRRCGELRCPLVANPRMWGLTTSEGRRELEQRSEYSSTHPLKQQATTALAGAVGRPTAPGQRDGVRRDTLGGAGSRGVGRASTRCITLSCGGAVVPRAPTTCWGCAGSTTSSCMRVAGTSSATPRWRRRAAGRMVTSGRPGHWADEGMGDCVPVRERTPLLALLDSASGQAAVRGKAWSRRRGPAGDSP